MGLVAAVVAFIAIAAPPASAHHGSEDTPHGTVTVPAGGSAWIPIEKTGSGDTIRWRWEVASGAGEHVSAQLVWIDSTGQEHEVAAQSPRQPSGLFVGPKDYQAGRIVWTNTGAAPAAVWWNYASSAPFWRRPAIFLPAMIPVFFLAGAYVLGKSLDARVRRRQPIVVSTTQG